MSCGIYGIYWDTPDLIYIGQSISLESRFAQHLYLLRKGEHFNYKMQKTFNKYGIPEYHVLFETPHTKLNEEEVRTISEFNSFKGPNGLNLTPGGLCVYGEDHPASMYSNAQIERVFKLLIGRVLPHKIISDETGVSVDVVKAVSTGKLHGWLASKFPEEYAELIYTVKDEHNSGDAHSCAVNSNTQILELFELLSTRETSLVDISHKTGLGYSLVSMVACGSTHKWLKDVDPIKYEKMLSNIGKSAYKFPKITNGVEVVQVENATKFCKERGLQHPNLSKVFNGTRKSHKGWYIYNE